MITPTFIGQRYKDTNTGNIWIANSTTPGDWTLEVQNFQTQWTPTTFKFGENIGLMLSDNMAGVTTLTLLQASILVVDLSDAGQVDLVTISLPNCVTVDPLGLYGGYLDLGYGSSLESVSAPLLSSVSDSLYVNNCPKLISVAFPSLATLGGTLQFQLDPLLTSLSLPSLITTGGKLSCSNSTLLANVSIPLWTPTNTKAVEFNSCALTLASVDHILDRCVANPAYVSGVVGLLGGTNAAPTQGPGSSHDILIARGVTINHN